VNHVSARSAVQPRLKEPVPTMMKVTSRRPFLFQNQNIKENKKRCLNRNKMREKPKKGN
jgi:hypothetical protein